MKTLSLCVLGAAFALPVGVIAIPSTASSIVAQEETQTISGSIKSVNKEAKSIVVTGSDKKDTTVRCDDKTVYMLDGKVATHDEVVKVGNNVSVTHKGGLASKIEATTKAPK